MTAVIEVRDLKKSYANVEAVRGVSFHIDQGKCFGLLGPNGAGKTTTIEIMEGIGSATSGQVLFHGRPIDRSFNQRIGIQFQLTALQDYLTVREVLELFQSFYDRKANVEELISRCDLGEFLDRDNRKLSGGQRQRLLLAIALVNDPDIVFLDEPTTGLDPQARRNFWDLIRGVKAQGKTVLLTTHYMEEAYALCDEIAIMDKGKIIAQGKPDSLLKQHFETVSIEIPEADVQGKSIVFENAVGAGTGTLQISTSNVNETIKKLIAADVSLMHLTVRPQNLEDLFIKLTNKKLQN